MASHASSPDRSLPAKMGSSKVRDFSCRQMDGFDWPDDAMTQGINTKVSPLHIAISWALVGMPLAWGIYKTVLKSLPLLSGR